MLLERLHHVMAVWSGCVGKSGANNCFRNARNVRLWFGSQSGIGIVVNLRLRLPQSCLVFRRRDEAVLDRRDTHDVR